MNAAREQGACHDDGMNQLKTVEYGGCYRTSTKVCTARLCGGVLSVTISGALTAAALLDIKRDVVSMYSTGVKAFLADYSHAIVAMDGAGLDAVLADETPGTGASLPAAMVVPEAYADLFIGHARRMARHHSRRVFLELAPALEWAHLQALQSGG